mmetsp:Transcript_13832/g.29068  ORF Transcript_13832/g.29068 Transcript_13832/m.29068 type:complete len:81 (-) Transcript_13832:149-391(-)
MHQETEQNNNTHHNHQASNVHIVSYRGVSYNTNFYLQDQRHDTTRHNQARTHTLVHNTTRTETRFVCVHTTNNTPPTNNN